MWCPFRMDGLCLGLERNSESVWECMICGWVENGVESANKDRARENLPEIPTIVEYAHRFVRKVRPSNQLALFESHYQSETHRRCVNAFLSANHPESMREKLARLLDPYAAQLATSSQRERVHSQLYLYVMKGSNIEATQCLISALSRLQACMKQDLVVPLALAVCKHLSLSLARKEKLEACPTFVDEDEMRSFLRGREDAWKRYKLSVLESGQVELIVSMVLPFVPEFTGPPIASRQWAAVRRDLLASMGEQPKKRLNAVNEECPSEIVITGAGTALVNGTYRQHGFYRGCFAYVKKGPYLHQGREYEIYIVRCSVVDADEDKWYISGTPVGTEPVSDDDVDYYASDVVEVDDCRIPTKRGWGVAGVGTMPVPRFTFRFSVGEDRIWWG
jgi:hypothetical protein